MKQVYLDLETTGTRYWKDGIHQISGCIDIDGVTVETFNWNVQPNPKAEISDEALAVAGKTREDLQAYPEMRKIYLEFNHLLQKHCNKFNKKDKYFLIGYNLAGFDMPFLRAWFKQNNDEYFGSFFWAVPIDVYVLAGEKLGDDVVNLPNLKLATMCRHFGIEVEDDRLHDAEYDIYLTKALHQKLK